jgi:uncharacterized protein YggE
MTPADPPAPIVTVRGESQKDVPPDLASLSVAANASAGSADKVREELAAASGQVAALLRRFADAIDRSTGGSLNVYPVYSARSGTRITGYRGSYELTVVMKDLGVLSDFVLAAAALPSSQVNGPWWSLRPNHPAFRSVRVDAIADARRRAEDYAAAVDMQVGDLLEISDLEGGFAGGREMSAFALGKAVDDQGFEFEPAPQTVSGQVTVRFTLRSAP